MKKTTLRKTIAAIMAAVTAASIGTAFAVSASAVQISVTGVEAKAEDVVFKPGIWCSPDEKTALIIREDGESAAIMSVNKNIGVPVRYEHNGADYTFHIAAYDNICPAKVSIDNSDFPVAKITWAEETGMGEATYTWVREGDQIGFDLGTWEDKDSMARFTFIDNETAILENLRTGLRNYVNYKYSFGNEANFVFYNTADGEPVLEQYINVDFVSENQMTFTGSDGTVMNLTRAAE